jgi:putative ABC transport system permease protein
VRNRGSAVTERSRLASRDLVDEALAGMLQRPGRAALTMLGTVLGIGALVAILGLTTTAAGQIDKRFSLRDATQVRVRDAAAADATEPTISFPADADQRAARIDGVEAAGVHWAVELPAGTGVHARPALGSGTDVPVEVHAASPGTFAAAEAHVLAGRTYGAFHDRTGQPVAVLGAVAAQKLGITRVSDQPAVFVGERAYTVVGILDEAPRLPGLPLAVILPAQTALRDFGEPQPAAPAEMLVRVRVGAAQVVARQVAVAIRPDDPATIEAVAPPDPRTLRSDVTSDVNSLFLLLAAVAVVIGALGIANTTLVAILERTAEIGVRRALGARPVHIAAQFLTESVVLGGLGGLVGTSSGVLVVVVVAVVRDWTAILAPATVFPAPFAGAAVGLVAGLYPAFRAARIEPIEALRR